MQSGKRIPSIVKVASSNLPTQFGHFKIHIFKDRSTLIEHSALVIGQINAAQDVLTRIHSECLTGDVFASARCDCGEQLNLAQQQIAEAGTGVIIYLRGHEGRGIGLGNKIRAYALQDEGLDTVDANLALGLPVDSRSFEIASEILKLLHVRSINLMTNNPTKLNALKQLGIEIANQIPLTTKPNKSNFHYLETKKARLGHILF